MATPGYSHAIYLIYDSSADLSECYLYYYEESFPVSVHGSL